MTRTACPPSPTEKRRRPAFQCRGSSSTGFSCTKHSASVVHRKRSTTAPISSPRTSDISRITVVVGRLAVTDYFDANTYANDPRTNFLNWNIYGAGAYDWTMDQLSWTWGALAELNQKAWAFRVGLLPPAGRVEYQLVRHAHPGARGVYG